MKKRRVLTIALLAVCAMTIMMLAGCGGKSTSSDVTVDTAKLAKELAEETVTSDTLTETASTMITAIYGLGDDQFAAGTAYMSAGSTACEAVAIECKEASQTGDVETLLKNRVQSQSDLYASYNAEQVTKLDDAIIKSTGKYVVMVVCDDTDKANEILKNYGF